MTKDLSGEYAYYIIMAETVIGEGHGQYNCSRM